MKCVTKIIIGGLIARDTAKINIFRFKSELGIPSNGVGSQSDLCQRISKRLEKKPLFNLCNFTRGHLDILSSAHWLVFWQTFLSFTLYDFIGCNSQRKPIQLIPK